jgi:hypothetical protein
MRQPSLLVCCMWMDPCLSLSLVCALQVMGLTADMRQQDAKVAALNQQLAESMRMNAELRGQVAMLSDETHRAAADRASAQVSMQQQQGQMAMAVDSSIGVPVFVWHLLGPSVEHQEQGLPQLTIADVSDGGLMLTDAPKHK